MRVVLSLEGSMYMQMQMEVSWEVLVYHGGHRSSRCMWCICEQHLYACGPVPSHLGLSHGTAPRLYLSITLIPTDLGGVTHAISGSKVGPSFPGLLDFSPHS